MGIVVGRAIDVDLELVEQSAGKSILQGDEVIGWMIEDLLFVKQLVYRRVVVQDVALCPPVQSRVFVESVVNADQRRIFVDGGRSAVSKVFVVSIAVRGEGARTGPRSFALLLADVTRGHVAGAGYHPPLTTKEWGS